MLDLTKLRDRILHPSSNMLFTLLLVLAIVVSALNLFSMHNNQQAVKLEHATFRAFLVDSMSGVAELRLRQSRHEADSVLSVMLQRQEATVRRLQAADDATQRRYWLAHPATHRALPAL